MTSDEAYPAEREPGEGRTGRRGARRAFLAAALRSPGQFGAVVPSSPSLAAVLASVVPTAGAPVVVELGPGTGAVTTAIDARLPPDARHLAVELDPRMVELPAAGAPRVGGRRRRRGEARQSCSPSAASSRRTRW